MSFSEDWNRDRAAIERAFNEYGFPEITTYAQVRPLLAYFDVRETPRFQQLPVAERLRFAVEACREIAKLPPAIRELNFRAGFALSLVVDNVVEHPRMFAYANVRPRGHSRGSTWDNVSGAGGSWEAPGAIVATRKNRKGIDHGATNLVLHEVGHNFDYAWGRFHVPVARTWRERYHQWRYGRRMSATAEWLQIHRKYVWPTKYEQKYSEEALVEAIARYFDSAETREHLRTHQREAFAFIEREVAGYAGPPPLSPLPAAAPAESVEVTRLDR